MPDYTSDQLFQEHLSYLNDPERGHEFQKSLALEMESLHTKRETLAYTSALDYRKKYVANYKQRISAMKQQTPFEFDASKEVIAFENQFNNEMAKWSNEMSPERAQAFKAQNINVLNELKIAAIGEDKAQIKKKDETSWHMGLLGFENTLEAGDPKVVNSSYQSLMGKLNASLSGGVIYADEYKKRVDKLEKKRDEFNREFMLYNMKKNEAEGGPQFALQQVAKMIKSKDFEKMSLDQKTKVYEEYLRLQKKFKDDGKLLTEQAMKEMKQTFDTIEKDFFSGAPETHIQDYVNASQQFEESLINQRKHTLKASEKQKILTQEQKVRFNRLSTLVALNNTKIMVQGNFEDFAKTVTGLGDVYDKKGKMKPVTQVAFQFYQNFRKRFNNFKGASDQVAYIRWLVDTYANAPQGIQQGMDIDLGLIQSNASTTVKTFLDTLPKEQQPSVGFAVRDDLIDILTEQHLRQTLFGTLNPSMTEDQKQKVSKSIDFFVKTRNIDGLESYLKTLTDNRASWDGVLKDATPSQKVFLDTLQGAINIRNPDITRNLFSSLRFATGSKEQKEQFTDVFNIVKGRLAKWLLSNHFKFEGVATSREALNNLLSHTVTGYLLKSEGGYNLASSDGVKFESILNFGNIRGMLEDIQDKNIKIGTNIVPKHMMSEPPKPGQPATTKEQKKSLMLATHLKNSLNMGGTWIQRFFGRAPYKRHGTDLPETNPVLGRKFIGLVLHLAGERIKNPRDLDNFRLNGLRIQEKTKGGDWVNLKRADGEDFEISENDYQKYGDLFGGDPEGFVEGILKAVMEQKDKDTGWTAGRTLKSLGFFGLPQAIEIGIKGFIEGLKPGNITEGDFVKGKAHFYDRIEKSGGAWVLNGNLSPEAVKNVEALSESKMVEDLYMRRQNMPPGSDLVFDITKGADFEKKATEAGYRRILTITSARVKKTSEGGFDVKWAIDGDSFVVNFAHKHPNVGNNMQVRLTGVDAPEMKLDKENALKAKDFVSKLINEADRVSVVFKGLGAYGRVVADLSVDGESLSELLLQQGLAIKMNFNEMQRRPKKKKPELR